MLGIVYADNYRGCEMLMLTPFGRQFTLEHIASDEGWRARAYKDTKGIATIGFGFNLEDIEMPLNVGQLWLQTIISNMEQWLWAHVPVYAGLSEPRKYVMLNMLYNLGTDGFLEFKNMLAALQADDYARAAREITASAIAPGRAQRLSAIMESGQWP
jgi:lysozyme